jgi:hypothetical protein
MIHSDLNDMMSLSLHDSENGNALFQLQLSIVLTENETNSDPSHDWEFTGKRPMQ